VRSAGVREGGKGGVCGGVSNWGRTRTKRTKRTKRRRAWRRKVGVEDGSEHAHAGNLGVAAPTIPLPRSLPPLPVAMTSPVEASYEKSLG